MINRKVVLVFALSIITLSLAACKSETKTVYVDRVVEIPADKPEVCSYSQWCGELPVIEPPIIVEPIELDIPMIPLEPSIPVKPQLPEFYSDQVTIISQNPFEAVINEGGSVHINYESGVQYFHEIDHPKFTVEYLYQPFHEWIITDGVDELCVRYSFETKKFGMGMRKCNWSNVNNGIELEDIRASYHNYKVIEARVYVNGVGGLGVTCM